RRARYDALVPLLLVDETDVVEHVVPPPVAQALDVLKRHDGVADVRIPLAVPDWVIDHDSVHRRVVVGPIQLGLERLPGDLAEGEVHAGLRARLRRPFGVLGRRRVFVGQEPDELRVDSLGFELLDFQLELLPFCGGGRAK
ncbi:MAG: hypothetical protein BJ554DRAFT_5420, partial [Olpidium bornovanus]